VPNSEINWRIFLCGVAKQALLTIEQREGLYEQKSVSISAFVFSDSLVEKTGKKIKGVSRIYNRVIKKHILGFQLLFMVFDGKIFIPVNFFFHREKGNN